MNCSQHWLFSPFLYFQQLFFSNGQVLLMKCYRIFNKSSLYYAGSFSVAQKMLSFSSSRENTLLLKIQSMIFSDEAEWNLKPTTNVKMVLIELSLRNFRYLQNCSQSEYISSQSIQLSQLSLQKNNPFIHSLLAANSYDYLAILTILQFHLFRYSFIALTKLQEVILNLKNSNDFISVSSSPTKLSLLFLATVLVYSTFLSSAFEETIMRLRAIEINVSCQRVLTLKYLSMRLMTLAKVSLKNVNLTHSFLLQLNKQALFLQYFDGSGFLTFSSCISSLVFQLSLLGSSSFTLACLTSSCFQVRELGSL